MHRNTNSKINQITGYLLYQAPFIFTDKERAVGVSRFNIEGSYRHNLAEISKITGLDTKRVAQLLRRITKKVIEQALDQMMSSHVDSFFLWNDTLQLRACQDTVTRELNSAFGIQIDAN